jgi:hypothetical protein
MNIAAQWKQGTGSIAPLLAGCTLGTRELKELYGIFINCGNQITNGGVDPVVLGGIRVGGIGWELNRRSHFSIVTPFVNFKLPWHFQTTRPNKKLTRKSIDFVFLRNIVMTTK